LAVEEKNPAEGTLLSFSRSAVFMHDVVVSENDVLEAGQCSRCVCESNFHELRLSVWTATIEWIRASR